MEILQFVAYTLITLCIIGILSKILDVCNAKIDEIQATTNLAEYDKLNLLIDQAQSIVTTVVQSVNQTYVDALKKAGKFTEETALTAKEQALDTAKSLITKEITTAIEKVYGNIDVYLDTLIEQTVLELKH